MGEKLGGVKLKKLPVRVNEPGVSLLLSNLRPGNKLHVQCLPLQRLDEKHRMVRTEFFLEGEIECKAEGHFFFRARAHFGKKYFEEVTLSVLGNREAVASLIRKGKPLQVTGLPIKIPPEREKTVLELLATETGGKTSKLFAVLRNTPPQIEGDDSEPTIPFGFPVKPSEETR
jgi:hypothetical protein